MGLFDREAKSHLTHEEKAAAKEITRIMFDEALGAALTTTIQPSYEGIKPTDAAMKSVFKAMHHWFNDQSRKLNIEEEEKAA